MSLSLILAVTLMPLVIVLLLLGLAITWLRMRRAAHDDVVDLVAMRKPVTPDPNYELRTSTEPFPYLPPVSVDNSRMSMDAAFIRKKDFGDFTRCTHHPTEPPVTTDDSLTTPTKRISILSESPSSEALAAFDFDTPSKPPVPQRSLKRSSGRSLHSVPTPIIKIEPASPSNPSLLFPQPDNQPLHLSPIAIGRAHVSCFGFLRLYHVPCSPRYYKPFYLSGCRMIRGATCLALKIRAQRSNPGARVYYSLKMICYPCGTFPPFFHSIFPKPHTKNPP